MTKLSQKSSKQGQRNRKPKASRDAMGQYIVPDNGQPLSSLGKPTPGPADYLPRIDVTKNSLPHHSIAGKYKQTKGAKDIPGPADYITTGDLIWKDKTVTLKGRSKSHFQEEASKYCTVIGPARYNVKHKELGRDGPKYSIARRQCSDLHTGPPNNIVQPVDSKGFETPGPNYRPNSSYFGRGPKKSFGIARTLSTSSTPGPSDYSVGDAPHGPAYSFGTKLPPQPNIQRTVNKDSPSPNTYTLGTTIGKATSVIIATRRREKPPEQDGPSPAAYYRRDALSHNKRAITLAYRWFDANDKRIYAIKVSVCHQKMMQIDFVNLTKMAETEKQKEYFMQSMVSLNTTDTDMTLPRHDYYNYQDLSPRSFVTIGSKADISSPMYFEDTPAPNSYKVETSIGKAPGASFKGDRNRNFDGAKKQACFLVPDFIDRNPAPNAYDVAAITGFGSTPTPAMKRRLRRQSQVSRGRSDQRFQQRNQFTYEIQPAPSKPSAVSMKGDRSRNFGESRQLNCVFLVPEAIEKTPGPGSYEIGQKVGGGHSENEDIENESLKAKVRSRLRPRPNIKENRDQMYELGTILGRSPMVTFKENTKQSFNINSFRHYNNEIYEPSIGDKTSSSSENEVKQRTITNGTDMRQSRPRRRRRRRREMIDNLSPGYTFKGSRERVFDALTSRNAAFLFPDRIVHTPGPGAYNIRTTIGSEINGRKSSLSNEYTGQFHGKIGPPNIENEFDSREKKPNRREFEIDTASSHGPAVSFKGRRLASLFGEPVRPGPADYVPTAVNLRKTPVFTNRSKTKPSYPDSLNYTQKDIRDIPGPGSYNISKVFAQNDSPAYKIGEKLREKENDVPAPNSYDYEHKAKIDAPAFSMGRRFEQPDSKVNPGPAAYAPKLQEGTPKFSMTARPSVYKKEENPAPNAYDLRQAGLAGPGTIGTTLKSRASPFVFSGFRSTNLLDEDPASLLTTRS